MSIPDTTGIGPVRLETMRVHVAHALGEEPSAIDDTFLLVLGRLLTAVAAAGDFQAGEARRVFYILTENPGLATEVNWDLFEDYVAELLGGELRAQLLARAKEKSMTKELSDQEKIGPGTPGEEGATAKKPSDEGKFPTPRQGVTTSQGPAKPGATGGKAP